MTATAGPAPGSDTVASPGALPATKPRGMFLRGLEVFLENKLAIVGVVLLVLIFGFCFLGPLFYQSAQRQDYPVMLGFIIVVAIATVVGSLLADIAYAVLDPRVRYA